MEEVSSHVGNDSKSGVIEAWIDGRLGYDGPLPLEVIEHLALPPFAVDSLSVEARLCLARNLLSLPLGLQRRLRWDKDCLVRNVSKAASPDPVDALAKQSQAWMDRPLDKELIKELGAGLSEENCGGCENPDSPDLCRCGMFADWLWVSVDVYTLTKIVGSCPMSRRAAASFAGHESAAVRVSLAKNRAALVDKLEVQLRLADDADSDVRCALAAHGPLLKATQEALCSGDMFTRWALSENGKLHARIARKLLDEENDDGGPMAETLAANSRALRRMPWLQHRLVRSLEVAVRAKLARNKNVLPEVAAELILDEDWSVRAELAGNEDLVAKREDLSRALALDRNLAVAEARAGTSILCPDALALSWCYLRNEDKTGVRGGAFLGAYLEAGGDMVLKCGLRFLYDAASLTWSYDPAFPHSVKLAMGYLDLPSPAREAAWRDAQKYEALSPLAGLIMAHKMAA